MHFQVIKDEFYNRIIKELRERVPEFHSMFDEDDGVYPVLGEFGRFLIENIDNLPVLNKSFDFVNFAIEVGGNETEEAIVMQIFEPIYENEALIKKVKPYFNEKSLKIFERFKSKYDEK